MATRLRAQFINLAVLSLLVVGLGLRLYGLNWDDNHHVHPDERWITMVAMDTFVPDPASDALDPRRSALNPYWNVRQQEARHFAYGSFPLYLVRAAATAVSTLAAATQTLAEWVNANDYDHINLIGRILSAIFDTLTIGLVFLLGRRIYNATVGLLAAAFMTFAVQNIQLAHFYAFDVVTTTVIVAAVYFGARVAQDGKRSDSAWLGAMVALAVASKFSALPLLLVIFLAHALRPLLSVNAARPLRPAGALGAVANPPLEITPQLSFEVSRALLGILFSLLCALVVFFIASPFTLLDFNGYWASISEQSDMVRGIVDFPYTRQYRDTGLAYWLENFVFWGVGPALGIASLAGLALVLFRAARRRATAPELLMLAWIVPYGLITLSFMVKFMRYLAPLTPFLCIMAAYGLWRIANRKLVLPALRDVTHGSAAEGSQIANRGSLSAIRYMPLAIVLVATALYAVAFMQIYTQPLTRVQASEWIYTHIPAGASLTAEVWDDSLPLGMLMDGRGRSQGEYKIVDMNLHEPDDANKLANLKQWIRQADYIVISSNRMYGWLTRLAERFPLTKRYYDLLFGDKLGFRQAAQFTSYPRLGSLAFSDDHADESFTVYDHPKVLIYQKSRNLSDADFDALFADVPPAKNPNPPVAATTARDKSLLLDRPVEQLPAVNDRAWNGVANASQWVAVFWWWLVVELLGLLALPIAFTTFRNFADRGYIFSKSIGLLIVAYVMWLLASLQLVMQHALAVWVITLLLLALAAVVAIKQRAEFLQFWRERRGIIIFEEALFVLAFLAFVFIRILDPDLWQPWNGGEKSMEFAFLNAILKSPYFPPYDPYFAGGYINYYYYGIYLVGVLVKLTGIASEVAFNLAIPTLFTLTMVNAFSLAFNLQWRGGWMVEREVNPSLHASRFTLPVLSGLLAMLFIAALGNLDGFVQIVEGLGKASGSNFQSGIIGVDGLVKAIMGLPTVLFDGKAMPAFDYWRSSRVIPNTINEFPLWSFLFADLHPHMIGIPFTVLALALTAHFIVRGESSVAREENTSLDVARSTLHGLMLALTLGAIAVINTWDAPTYLGLGLGMLLLKRYWSDGVRSRGWLRTLVGIAVIGAASIALYWPFFSNYKALYVGLGLTDQHTEFQPFVTIWGFFLLVALTFIVGEIARHTRGTTPACYLQVAARHALRLPRLLELVEVVSTPASFDAVQDKRGEGPGWGLQLAAGGLILLAMVSLILFLLGQTVIAILIWPFVCSALLLTRHNLEPRIAFLNWLAFWAFAILLGVEIVFLQDFLSGGEAKRMNTIFKFYIQVWVLLSLLAAIALPELWTRSSCAAGDRLHARVARSTGQGTRRGIWPAVWQAAIMLLIGASLIFTFIGTNARVNDRFPTARPPIGTLDGLAFMGVGRYDWPDERNHFEMKYDLDAIRWLQANVSGTPVIAEANLSYYREGGLRISSYTGLPTLLGFHQGEQRYSDDVGKRDGEVSDFFNTRDSARAMDLIRQLHIRYIYLGQLERATYDKAGLDKFDAMVKAGVLDAAYQNSQVKIYRVRG